MIGRVWRSPWFVAGLFDVVAVWAVLAPGYPSFWAGFQVCAALVFTTRAVLEQWLS